MQARGVPLKDWDVTIRRGVITGLNEAFIIDTATHDALIEADSKSAEIIKPVLRGRDIQRWRAEWAGLWLISTFPPLGLDIDMYPAVKEHLIGFGQERLQQTGAALEDGGKARSKTGYKWFELQNTVAYYEEFAKKKLFWIDLAERGRFALAEAEIFCLNSAYMLTGPSIRYLCGVLNSALITYYIKNMALSSGMGTPRWFKTTVLRIPVPQLLEREEQPFVALVDRILDAKDRDPDADTSALERQIDRLVYDLYGLTNDEIAAVEARLS